MACILIKEAIILFVLSLNSLCSSLMKESLPVSAEVCVVPKCCLPNQSIPASGQGCQNSSLRFAPDFWNPGKPNEVSESQLLDIIVGDPCQYGKFRLEPEEESSDEFHILCNGSLLLPFHSGQLYAMNQYCLESFHTRNEGFQESVTLPLLCFPPPPPLSIFHKTAVVLYPVGLLISLPFLVVTAVVFMRVSELGDARGKSLSCQCSIQAITCVSLATILLFGTSLPLSIYVALEFVIQFAFTSCFTWLNVLCIETWWRLTRNPLLSVDYQERVLFAWYSLYAWSVPLVAVVVAALKGLDPVVPGAYLQPSSDRNSAFPYFYLPIGLLFLVDISLLYMSVGPKHAAVHQHTEEELGFTERNTRPHCNGASMDMVKPCMILLLVMGLHWSLEMISYFVGGLVEMWVLTITLNALHGVIICSVFILRVPRVRTLISANLDRKLFNPNIEVQ